MKRRNWKLTSALLAVRRKHSSAFSMSKWKENVVGLDGRVAYLARRHHGKGLQETIGVLLAHMFDSASVISISSIPSPMCQRRTPCA